MSLLAAILIAYLGIPIATVLLVIAAFMLRGTRPKRAKLVFGSLIVGLIGGAVILALASYSSIAPQALEMAALVIGGLFCAGVLLGVIALMIPLPDKGWPVGLVVLGLFIVFVSGLLAYEVSNINFAL